MRDFYIYGFKVRDEYTRKSARSYDNERRRLASWLNDFMRFRETKDGKQVYIAINSRNTTHNPLFNAWKARSFTDNNLTLHFLILDILHEPNVVLTLNEILEKINDQLAKFDELTVFDKSTVRKKLNAYVKLGLLEKTKESRIVYYNRSKDEQTFPQDMLHFFAETTPCGVIGSFINDRQANENAPSLFSFKHHFITGTLDCEILNLILNAIQNEQSIAIEVFPHRKKRLTKTTIVPLKIMRSATNGREYVLGFNYKYSTISPYRLDSILNVKALDFCEDYALLSSKLDDIQKNMFGINPSKNPISLKDYVDLDNAPKPNLSHVEFTITYNCNESFIPKRLEREKRCGTVEYLNESSCKFSADVHDAHELLPWIRTFIGRITSINFSDKTLEKLFLNDLQKLYSLYNIDAATNETTNAENILLTALSNELKKD